MNGTVNDIKNSPTGKVQVYDLIERKWKWVWFVDAKEMCTKGVASTSGPSIEVVKEGMGRIKICQVELQRYLDDGFTVVEGEEIPEQTEEPPQETSSGLDFTKYSREQLLSFAAAAGLGDMSASSDSDIAASLDVSGYLPE